MHLIYLDESGKPHPNDVSENFVVAGVILNEEVWNEVDEKITNLKKDFFGKTWELYEIHMTEILHGKNLYHIIPLENRLILIKKIYELIDSVDIRVVGSIIKKKKMYAGKDIETWGLRLLFERICWNLSDLNQKLIKEGQKKQYGIMILDSINQKFDDIVRKKIKNLLLDGTHYQDNKYLIEDALFTCSHWRNLCQMADCIAYTLNYNNRSAKFKDTDKNKVIEDGYKIILKKIFTKNESLNYSMKIFP